MFFKKSRKLVNFVDVWLCVFFVCFFRSRKLNSQLENAIQEAMIELDRMSSSSPSSTTTTISTSSPSSTVGVGKTKMLNRTIKSRRQPTGGVAAGLVSTVSTVASLTSVGGGSSGNQRLKPIKIAPAPPPPPLQLSPTKNNTITTINNNNSTSSSVIQSNQMHVKCLRSSK